MASLSNHWEQAILVGIKHAPAQNSRAVWFTAEESLGELMRLSETAGVEIIGQTWQDLRGKINPASFIGQGKVMEVKKLVQEQGANVVIIDGLLSPGQQRSLEKGWGVKVIDRSQLILDIFAQRARSLEGKLQVELAQLEYLLPRLTRHWTHLSRLGGGVGTRGPGETQLEVDRRRVRERMATLRRRLKEVERTRLLHRKGRAEVPFAVVALVGYTNSGKSTLMNTLTQAGVLVEDKLFATLDPTMRRLDLPEGGQAMLVDTVGFIDGLPHQLIDAFKSTLEEVRTANLLLHLVDVTQPYWQEQMAVVENVLGEIGAGNNSLLTVFNKMDLLSADQPCEASPQISAWPGWDPVLRPPLSPQPGGEGPFHISALTRKGIPDLLVAIERRVGQGLRRVRISLPLSCGYLLAWLHRYSKVLETHHTEDTVTVTVLISPKVAGQLHRHLEKESEMQIFSEGSQDGGHKSQLSN
jgi:GTP-binding protein HflX